MIQIGYFSDMNSSLFNSENLSRMAISVQKVDIPHLKIRSEIR